MMNNIKALRYATNLTGNAFKKTKLVLQPAEDKGIEHLKQLAMVSECKSGANIDLPAHLEELAAKFKGKDKPNALVDMYAYLTGVATKLKGEKLMREAMQTARTHGVA